MSDIQHDAPVEDRSLGMIIHLSGILLGFILPLIMWIVNKDKAEKAWLTEESKEALNFQITMLFGWIIASVTSVILIGLLLYPVLLIGNIVLCIMAGIKANNGESYRYPVAIRLIK